jgi:Plant transposon protein
MFNKTFLKMYRKKYLKKPSQQDMVRIAVLHEKVHGVPGMIGSLDCMHTRWKNCSVAWQGSNKGQKGYPSIVSEAVCDHHCFSGTWSMAVLVQTMMSTSYMLLTSTVAF